MKRIFFYSNHREYDNALGITHKVHGEINAFRDLGYEVIYSAYTENGAAVFDNNGNVLYECKHALDSNALNRITRRGLLLKCCSRFLKQDKTRYDIGYLRFHFFPEIPLRYAMAFQCQLKVSVGTRVFLQLLTPVRMIEQTVIF